MNVTIPKDRREAAHKQHCGGRGRRWCSDATHPMLIWTTRLLHRVCLCWRVLLLLLLLLQT